MPVTSRAETGRARDWLKARSQTVHGPLRVSMLAGLAAGIFTIVQAGLFAWIVAAAVTRDQPLTELAPLFAGLAGVIVLRAVSQWLQETRGLEAGLAVRRTTRRELLDHLGQLGPARLRDQHSAGLAIQAFDHIEALQGYYARFLPQLVIAVAVPLIILLVVWQLDWLAAVFLLAAAPLIPLFMALIGIGADYLHRRQFQALTRLAGHFLDRVRGLRTLQLFGHIDPSISEVVAAADAYRRRSMKTLRVAFLSSAILEFFAAVAIAVVAIYIGFGLLGYIEFGPADELDLFSGLFILLLAPEFFQPLRTLSQFYHDRAAALGAADALTSLLDRPLATTGTTEALFTHPVKEPALVLTDARVEQPGRGSVLGPLNLSIPAGSFTVIHGPSGSGKTTLLELLAGFRQPDSGRVLRDGRPPSGYGDFAWMDQQPFLMQGSLADNLLLAAPGASRNQLWQACERAGLAGWLHNLPDGLDTPITEAGAGLSGGQAQRLALARVFLSPAPLVLLDEPTAQLDPETERQVLKALSTLAQEQRTIVVASHQTGIDALADAVYSLEKGKLSGVTADA